jgi:hypothetical protein
MHLSLAALGLAFAGWVAAGVGIGAPAPESGNPLHSTECRAALDALQAQEAALAAAPRAAAPPPAVSLPPAPASAGASRSPAAASAGASRSPAADASLEAARRRAALACLRSRTDPPAPRQPIVRSPTAVEPLDVPRAAAPLPSLRAPSPPPAPAPGPRPRFITSCDAVGCWADDGSRLQRAGPNLRGPRGVCTRQGTLLTCP